MRPVAPPGADPSAARTAYDVALLAVTKLFGPTAAVRDLTLRIERGTFFSLLGPSGCGKTTTLRLVAGFEQPSSGSILIRGQDVAGLPPYRRDVNTVFQHYALFPHMTAAQNIAYGLRQRRVARAEIDRRVGEALEMVRLPGAGERRPTELSGGQQQRVALARALVNRPTVLLLDEPLSALDLKLRKEMQGELKVLQQRVGITFVYVTHDQDEAITLSDRIAVMNAGHVEQEGTPTEIYERPRTRFVADFIGLTNFIDGTVVESDADGGDGAGGRRVVVQTALGPIICAGPQPEVARGERVTLTLRPEKVLLLPDGARPPAGWNHAAGMVTQATFLGPQNEYRVRPEGADLVEMTIRQQNVGTQTVAEASDGRGGGLDSGWRTFGPGERVTLAWRHEASLILRDAGTAAHRPERDVGQAPDPRASVHESSLGTLG